MAVRSRRLFGPVIVNNTSPATLYTVPSGRTAVLRRVMAWARFDTGTSRGRLHLTGSTSSLRLWEITGPPAGTQELGYFVLNPGDTLVWSNPDLAGAWVVAGFGSLLLGAPE